MSFFPEIQFDISLELTMKFKGNIEFFDMLLKNSTELPDKTLFNPL